MKCMSSLDGLHSNNGTEPGGGDDLAWTGIRELDFNAVDTQICRLNDVPFENFGDRRYNKVHGGFQYGSTLCN